VQEIPPADILLECTGVGDLVFDVKPVIVFAKDEA
jgi:hypothetical protein